MTAGPMLAIVLSLPAQEVGGLRFGVAARVGGVCCLVVAGARVPAGTAVWVITPGVKQELFRAQAGDGAEDCDALHASTGSRRYRLDPPAIHQACSPVGIAVLGDAKASLSDGLVKLEPAGGKGFVTVRSCTSTERAALDRMAREATRGAARLAYVLVSGLRR